MLIGVPKEIKDNEFRVGLIPSSVQELVHHGHECWCRRAPASAPGLSDADYMTAGAHASSRAPDRIFAEAEMIVKVKEPLAAERKQLRPGQILFTYLHLAPDRRADAGPRRQPARSASPTRPSPPPIGRAAAADADVGGRRAAGPAGRRPFAGEGAGRTRRAARRRAGRAAGRGGRSSAAASPAPMPRPSPSAWAPR